MARYIDYIGTFDFSIELCSGTSEEMASADYLSRMTNQIQSLTIEEMSNIWMTNGVTITELIEAQSRDEEVNQLKNGYGLLNSKKFKVKTINNVKVAVQIYSGYGR